MKRAVLLGVLLYGLLVTGLTLITGEFLVLALPLLVYLGAALLYGPGKLQLTATRTFSADRVFSGAEVAVRVAIVNRGRALEQIAVRDVVPPALQVIDGAPELLTALGPGEQTVLEYRLQGRRGRFDFPGLQVAASDRLGLFERWTTLPAAGRLLVLPDVIKLRRLAIRPLRTRAHAGPVPARQGGSGIEFFGLREYQSGDPMRWINWRASARHPHSLFTNEFEQERIADVGLILDARQRSDVHSKGESLFERAVLAASSLADLFLGDGNRVGLLIYGGFLDWTFPGYGKVQRERVLRALARAEPGESLVFERLNFLPTRFFPAKSQLVLVSPLCADDLAALVRLRALGYQLLIVSPDPISFELDRLDPHPQLELAARIARLERAPLLRRLRQAGIQIVDWRVDDPFDSAVHASLGRTPHWLRSVGAGR
ncbi:MAG: DUF58 domain-containing protein [Anaerolineae bacterium]|nr:DUF58 domain-containing protein [Anaerolineae bacterium]